MGICGLVYRARLERKGRREGRGKVRGVELEMGMGEQGREGNGKEEREGVIIQERKGRRKGERS